MREYGFNMPRMYGGIASCAIMGFEGRHHALQVLIDGIDIQALQLKWLRQHMGIVNQARAAAMLSPSYLHACHRLDAARVANRICRTETLKLSI